MSTSKTSPAAERTPNARKHRSVKINECGAREQGPARPDPGLYIVATPIGNARDITLRALDVLAQADIVACEDSRVTGRLLQMHNISAKLLSYHDHNGAKLRPRLIERLKSGEIVALVSDAGTPLISDPGYKLVRAARDADLPVFALPGATAAMAALVVSGLPTDNFLFAGFLPSRDKARLDRLAGLNEIAASLIFYESGPRLAKSLAAMADVLGPRDAVVARELTKLYEETRAGTLQDLAVHYQSQGAPKGEIVIVVAPAEDAGNKLNEADVDALLRAALRQGSVKDAVRAVMAASGWPRGEIYRRALAMKDAAD